MEREATHDGDTKKLRKVSRGEASTIYAGSGDAEKRDGEKKGGA